jgi:bifunctional non-homologous end joining protein LigD
MKTNVKGLVFYAFDLLLYDGEDYREKELLDRKKKLKTFLKKISKKFIYSEHFEVEDTSKILKEFCGLNLEGVISKRKDSIYQGKRSEDWIKTKCQKNDEFVVIGYLPGEDQPFGALLVGEYVDKKLMFVGRVGRGLAMR